MKLGNILLATISFFFLLIYFISAQNTILISLIQLRILCKNTRTYRDVLHL